MDTIRTMSHKRKLHRILSVAAVVGLMTVLACTPAFAAGDITSAISSGMESFWGLLKGICGFVAIVMAAIAAYKLILGGQRGMEMAKTDLLKTGAFIALVLLAPTLIQTIYGWFSGSSSWVSSFG